MVAVDSLFKSRKTIPPTTCRQPFVDMLSMMAQCLIWCVIFRAAAVNLRARHFVAKAGINLLGLAVVD